MEKIHNISCHLTSRVYGHDFGMIRFEFLKGSCTDKSVVMRQLMIHSFMCFPPCLLGFSNVPSQFPNFYLVFAINDDIGDHGNLGCLDLEIPYGETISWINLFELC